MIYNSLGLNGGQVQSVVRYFDKPQWTEELQHQHPDLVVINYGTNESIYAEYIERSYPGELRQVIERVKAAVPRASVLIMSPMDRGQRDPPQITTVPTLPRLVEIQRQMAAEMGCAFFNTFQAMGGAGTMARWYDSTPQAGERRLYASIAGRRAQSGRAARSGARIRLSAIQSARTAETPLVRGSLRILAVCFRRAGSGRHRQREEDRQEDAHKKHVRVPAVYVSPVVRGAALRAISERTSQPVGVLEGAGALVPFFEQLSHPPGKYVAAHFAVRRFAHRVR